MKHYSFTIIILLISISTFSQVPTFRISGNVYDENNQPIAYASTLILRNDTLVQGNITNEQGYFNINANAGSYRLQVSCVGYKPFSQEITVDKNTIVEQIHLIEGMELGEVVISAAQKLISYEQGRIKLTVAGSKLANLPSSMDVLAFVPGVQVQQNSISVIGKGKPLILINGKEVKQTSEITNLQPEMIKNITMDRNPSARYDAAYSSIIRIETKREFSKDFALQYIQGAGVNRNFIHSETLNLNHSKGIFNNFLSYKFKQDNNTEAAINYQKINQNGQQQVNSYDARMQSKENQHSITAGTNMKWNEKNNINTQYSFNYSEQNATVAGNETMNGIMDRVLNVNRNGRSTTQDHNVNIAYTLTIDSIRSLNIYTDYTRKYDVSNENILSKNAQNNTELKSNLANHSLFDVYSVRTEHNTSLFSYFNLLAGLRYGAINSKAEASMNSSDETANFNNSSILSEKSVAAYAILSHQFSTVFAEIGIRAEHTESNYSRNGISVFEKPRIMSNLLPSISISYKTSDKLQFNLNYASKIKRPTFYELDPTVNYLSSTLYEQGNTSLKPTINHKVTIGTVIKNNLNFSVGYTMHQNLIAYATIPNPSNKDILINTPINIEKGSSIDLNANYTLSLGAFTSNVSGNFLLPFVSYPYNNKVLESNIPQVQLIAINTYSFSPFTFAFCNLAFTSKHNYLNSTFMPTYQLTAGINFLLMRGKMVLTVFGNDLLGKSTPSIVSQYGNVQTGQISRPDTRMIGATLKINFNQFRNIFKKSESNQSEVERIKK